MIYNFAFFSKESACGIQVDLHVSACSCYTGTQGYFLVPSLIDCRRRVKSCLLEGVLGSGYLCNEVECFFSSGVTALVCQASR